MIANNIRGQRAAQARQQGYLNPFGGALPDVASTPQGAIASLYTNLMGSLQELMTGWQAMLDAGPLAGVPGLDPALGGDKGNKFGHGVAGVPFSAPGQQNAHKPAKGRRK